MVEGKVVRTGADAPIGTFEISAETFYGDAPHNDTRTRVLLSTIMYSASHAHGFSFMYALYCIPPLFGTLDEIPQCTKHFAQIDPKSLRQI